MDLRYCQKQKYLKTIEFNVLMKYTFIGKYRLILIIAVQFAPTL